MELHSLLTTLSSNGVKLAVNGNSLEVDAPQGAITPELRCALAEHKAEIIQLLNSQVGGSTALPILMPLPESRYEPFPLTDMQYAFWVGRSGVLELGEVANHGYYEIEGQNLDLERLNAALQTLIDRHDMLRAIVLPDGQQQVQKTVPPYQMQVFDLRGKAENQVRQTLEEIRDRLSHQVVPADQWPLFEFCATCLDGDRVRLHISYDLQVFDAWSLFRLFDEWAQLYTHPDAQPETLLPPLELSFRDYVLAEQALQATELYARSQAYWLSRLDTLPAAPDLPLAKHPKDLKQHRSRRYEDRLEQADWQQLKQRSAQMGLTPSALLLAAFAEILAGWSKHPQFTINLALFNRLPLHPQVNSLIGDFTSVTLLAIDHSTPAPFRDRAIRLQKQLWQDLEHRYFSGVRVIRELARKQGTPPSAMPIIFTSTLGFRSLGQETLTFSHFGERVYGISQASQAWMDVQVWEEKETLTFNWDVVEGLFPEGLIDAMFESYGRLLKQLAHAESSWVETTRSLLPPAQRLQREAVNATDAPIPDTLLQDLFIEQVPIHANDPAVITSQCILTYQELSDRSNQVGHRLRQLGVVPNQGVAIAMEKGWEQIVAVLGILASGAAYVPIDPTLPQERLGYLLENSQATIVLTQSRLVKKLNFPEDIECLCIDAGDCDRQSVEPLPSVQSADDLAYIIYTSGSTGNPKGVMITHRNVANVVVHTNQRFHVNAQDRILALTALHHDLSVYDIFGLLSAGGAIVMPDADAVKNPSHWAAWMEREQVTLWNSVPALMEMLVDQAEEQAIDLPNSLRLTILGGDWLPVSLPDRLRKLVPTTQILSIGGPTETTIWNIGYLIEQVDPMWKSIPYGQPMANSKYYILNDALEDCPIWIPGQMYCAGVQVAKGYWRAQEKTHAQFMTHPHTGERLYRTGDLGRYLPNGQIEFLGRVDFQIKIRGQRIEAGEIEATLTQHPQVRSAIVAVAPHPDRLVAYVVDNSESTANPEELKQFLHQKLPAHMVPSAFVFLDALPLSTNGKVDRNALLTHNAQIHTVEATYIAPHNGLEQTVATIFQDILELSKVGINDNFFDMGGNSLLLAKVYRSLLNALPDETTSISLIDLFYYPTVKTLAQRLNQDHSTPVFIQPIADREQKLAQGKDRLKQRLKQSKQT
ncbi:MAG TPA: amino acid adenylation domain-containing protein [Coleofasciculaceae cyanobacterium]|jgi:amino acid adenylation domain-containing protein